MYIYEYMSIYTYNISVLQVYTKELPLEHACEYTYIPRYIRIYVYVHACIRTRACL